MKKNQLIVSEVFHTLQGEGQTMGIPAVFLRLAGCNLLCESKGWRCDTIEVWRKGLATNFEYVLPRSYVTRLYEGAHLVISGGEPLLHQSQVERYLHFFYSAYKFLPIIEVETNGTIIPSETMLELVDYWNCSPKLNSSGTKWIDRFNIVALTKLDKESKHVCFKFVIAQEEDILEIITEFSFVTQKNVILMPAGSSQGQLNLTRKMVAEHAIQMGWKYCDRLHVVIWNQATGV